jgi:hypothetical protein
MITHGKGIIAKIKTSIDYIKKEIGDIFTTDVKKLSRHNKNLQLLSMEIDQK